MKVPQNCADTVNGAAACPGATVRRAEAGGLTCVARMPCLIPVLCVPDPMTPPAVTSDTAPRLGVGRRRDRGHVRLLGTMPSPGCSVTRLRTE